MEYLDLVNENDEIIGVTTKAKSHMNSEIHRVAAIFVFDKKGRLLIQEHLESGGKYDHSVGGHVRQGETYDEAAKREAYEELGLTEKLHKISVFYPGKVFSGCKNIHMYGLYEVAPSEKWKFTPNHEVKNVIPLPIEEIANTMNCTPDKFVKGCIYTMREYIRLKKLQYEIVID